MDLINIWIIGLVKINNFWGMYNLNLEFKYIILKNVSSVLIKYIYRKWGNNVLWTGMNWNNNIEFDVL